MMERPHPSNSLVCNCSRPLHPSDLPGISNLLSGAMARQLDSLIGFIPNQADWQRQTFADPDYEPDLMRGIFRNQVLIGCVIAVRRPWKTGREQTGFIKWLAVDTAFQDDDITEQLLEIAEAELARKGVTTIIYGSSAPRYLLPGVPANDHSLRQLLIKYGWQLSSERINLHLDLQLHKLETPPPRDAVNISLAEADERESLLNFIEEDFSHSWAIECEDIFRSASDAFAIILRTAGDNAIAGFCAVGTTNPGWLGPMGIAASLRGRGYGRMLLLAALTEAKTRELHNICIPWVNEAFYTNCLGCLRRSIFLKAKKSPAK